jgi:hypothetical protein
MGCIALVAAIVWCGGLSAQPDAKPSDTAPPGSGVASLVPIPQVRLEAPGDASPAERERIKSLIDDLVKITQPDAGLSATLSGDAFAPLPQLPRKGRAFLLTNHNLGTSEAFTELVKLGPRALPQLLEAITDARPTGLKIVHDNIDGGMWFGQEMWGNPANERKHKLFGDVRVGAPGGFPNETLSEYAVKVGDVCFVIVGQIVGRSYSAVRYQPTACIVVNSPVHDPKLAEQARTIWADPQPSQHLLDSLLTDFCTRGVHQGNSLDHWSIGSGFQIGAATRLLYFFPDQAAPLVAKRLDELDVSQHAGLDEYMKQTVANGVRADDFIAAVSWSDRPEIRAALARLTDRTDDPEVFVTSLPQDVAVPAATTARLIKMLDDLPQDDPGPYGKTYKLLLVLASQPLDKAKPEFERLSRGGLMQRRSVCMALREKHPAFAIEVLTPLLTDTQSCNGWTHPEVGGQNQPRHPIRVCDEAAVAISTSDPSLSFQMLGTPETKDAHIAKMREALRERK